jgi:hypothetical protein
VKLLLLPFFIEKIDASQFFHGRLP